MAEREEKKIYSLSEYGSKLGVSSITLKQLREAGFESLNEIILYNPNELSLKTGISEERAGLIIRRARRIVKCKRIYTAFELKTYGRKFFTTGCKALDQLFGGGIELKALTEFVGEFGCGKTQICHQLCVTVQLPRESGGLEAKAVFIDTEGTFSYERIENIANRFGISPEFVLKNIYVVRAITVSELEDIVESELISILRDNVKLIAVDSLIALYRAELKGLENLAFRQQKINYLLDWLKRFAEDYELAVVYTNQVVQAVSGFIVYKAPAGGNIVAHAGTYRVFLHKRKDCIEAEIFDSPRHPKVSCVFAVTNEGVVDVEEKKKKRK